MEYLLLSFLFQNLLNINFKVYKLMRLIFWPHYYNNINAYPLNNLYRFVLLVFILLLVLYLLNFL